MWRREIRREVHQRLSAGETLAQVVRSTGVPRSTVKRWRGEGAHRLAAHPDAVRAWKPPCERSYCYVLGMYLGDGHVTRVGSSGTASFALDSLYPGVIAELQRSLAITFDTPRVRTRVSAVARLTRVCVSTRLVICAFPQHGPGKKHDRRIVLEPWQRDVTARHSEQLLRGLIHSDGCRSVNRFRTKLPSGRVVTYEYPRYFFTNLSADIRGIFCEHCEQLGIRWTQSYARNISVAHRGSVELLDEFVGPNAERMGAATSERHANVCSSWKT